MNRNDRRTAAAQPTDARRARTLAVSLAVLLAAATLYAHNVQAACGDQSDFLAGVKPLPAPVRPADCSRVFQPAPDFTWPAARDAAGYTVVLTLPDGTVRTRSTDSNWLAWDEALPAGRYTWQVIAAGARPATSQPRSFTVDAVAAALAPHAAGTSHDAASPTTYPADSQGSITLAVTAAAPGADRETAPRATRRAAASTAIAWTSHGASAAQAH